MAKEELNQTTQELAALASKLALLQQNLTQLETLYNECINKPPEVVEKVVVVNPLNFSEWFKGMEWTNNYTFSSLSRECSTLGELSLPCVIYLIQRTGLVNYITLSPDPFLNVEQTLIQGRGDCEEFASLEWAFLKKYKELYPDRRLEVMIPSKEPAAYYLLYNGGDEPVKVSGYQSHLMGEIGGYDYGVACYNVNETMGHCGVVVSLKPLTKVSSFLGAKLIDAEKGIYLGTIGEDFYICTEDKCGPNGIWVLMYNETLWVNGTYYTG